MNYPGRKGSKLGFKRNKRNRRNEFFMIRALGKCQVSRSSMHMTGGVFGGAFAPPNLKSPGDLVDMSRKHESEMLTRGLIMETMIL